MYVSVYQIVEIHFLDVSWRFPFTNPFSKNTIVPMLLTSAMNMFAFKLILVIKCSIIINERKKKHCHFGGCYIWRHLIIQSVAYTIFFFTFTRSVLKQIATKWITKTNQRTKKRKKKNRKQEEIPKFNRAFYFFYLCLPSSSERLFRFLMKQILVTPLAN